MGGGASKEEMVYMAVQKGNLKAIKELRQQGAGLEHHDSAGRTPLMLACRRADMYETALLLLQLGANAQAYQKGPDGGYPIHHAARAALDKTITLLLAYGANPLVTNDSGRSALDLARERGFVSTVRLIEDRVCLFSGAARQQQLSTLFEAIVPQWVFKSVWLVVLPSSVPPSRLGSPSGFDLAIYPSYASGAPSTVIKLRPDVVSMAKQHSPDPITIIADPRNGEKHKFLKDRQNPDPHQMLRLYHACNGVSQRPPVQGQPMSPSPVPVASSQPYQQPPAQVAQGSSGSSKSEDLAFQMALKESLRTASEERGRMEAAAAAAGGGADGLGGWGAEPATQATLGGWGADVPVTQASTSAAAQTGGQSAQQQQRRPTSSSSSRPATVAVMSAAEPAAAGDWGDSSTAGQDGLGGWASQPTTRPQTQSPAAAVGASAAVDTNFAAAAGPSVLEASQMPPSSLETAPSAPPLPPPLSYPSIDNAPIPPPELNPKYSEARVREELEAAEKKTGQAQCVICWDAAAEAVCVPCGHVAGCVDCLAEVKEKNWGCPVCRTPIASVVKLYHVS